MLTNACDCSVALPTITDDVGGAAIYLDREFFRRRFMRSSAHCRAAGRCLRPPEPSDIVCGVVRTFALGRGIAGGTSNVAMLIAGRTIQGLGAGGIYVLIVRIQA